MANVENKNENLALFLFDQHLVQLSCDHTEEWLYDYPIGFAYAIPDGKKSELQAKFN